MDKQCASYCIELIRCLMQDEPIPDLPEDISLGELYAFAKYHGVEAMVYHGLEQLTVDEKDPVWQDWSNRADMLLTQSIVQMAERDLLFAELPAAGVAILPVKGCWLKEQYPEIDYRQMSDLDILIHPEDTEKARSVMLRLGYHIEEDTAENHDAYLKPPYMGVELHLSLLPENAPQAHYFDTVWSKARACEGFSNVWQLKPEDEYIYYILHLFKHVLYAGTGIRSFLDGLVYRTVYPDMDREYLAREFRELGMTEFVSCVEAVTDCWFRTGTDIPASMETMAQSILSAGSYGTESQRSLNEVTQVSGKLRHPLAVKFVYFLACLFPPLKVMRKRYPVLVRFPVLLPVLWIWRLVSKLVFRPNALPRLLKTINKEGDKLWSEFNWQIFRSK